MLLNELNEDVKGESDTSDVNTLQLDALNKFTLVIGTDLTSVLYFHSID